MPLSSLSVIEVIFPERLTLLPDILKLYNCVEKRKKVKIIVIFVCILIISSYFYNKFRD